MDLRSAEFLQRVLPPMFLDWFQGGYEKNPFTSEAAESLFRALQEFETEFDDKIVSFVGVFPCQYKSDLFRHAIDSGALVKLRYTCVVEGMFPLFRGSIFDCALFSLFGVAASRSLSSAFRLVLFYFARRNNLIYSRLFPTDYIEVLLQLLNNRATYKVARLISDILQVKCLCYFDESWEQASILEVTPGINRSFPEIGFMTDSETDTCFTCLIPDDHPIYHRDRANRSELWQNFVTRFQYTGQQGSVTDADSDDELWIDLNNYTSVDSRHFSCVEHIAQVDQSPLGLLSFGIFQHEYLVGEHLRILGKELDNMEVVHNVDAQHLLSTLGPDSSEVVRAFGRLHRIVKYWISELYREDVSFAKFLSTFRGGKLAARFRALYIEEDSRSFFKSLAFLLFTDFRYQRQVRFALTFEVLRNTQRYLQKEVGVSTSAVYSGFNVRELLAELSIEPDDTEEEESRMFLLSENAHQILYFSVSSLLRRTIFIIDDSKLGSRKVTGYQAEKFTRNPIVLFKSGSQFAPVLYSEHHNAPDGGLLEGSGTTFCLDDTWETMPNDNMDVALLSDSSPTVSHWQARNPCVQSGRLVVELGDQDDILSTANERFRRTNAYLVLMRTSPASHCLYQQPPVINRLLDKGNLVMFTRTFSEVCPGLFFAFSERGTPVVGPAQQNHTNLQKWPEIPITGAMRTMEGEVARSGPYRSYDYMVKRVEDMFPFVVDADDYFRKSKSVVENNVKAGLDMQGGGLYGLERPTGVDQQCLYQIVSLAHVLPFKTNPTHTWCGVAGTIIPIGGSPLGLNKIIANHFGSPVSVLLVVPEDTAKLGEIVVDNANNSRDGRIRKTNICNLHHDKCFAVAPNFLEQGAIRFIEFELDANKCCVLGANVTVQLSFSGLSIISTTTVVCDEYGRNSQLESGAHFCSNPFFDKRLQKKLINMMRGGGCVHNPRPNLPLRREEEQSSETNSSDKEVPSPASNASGHSRSTSGGGNLERDQDKVRPDPYPRSGSRRQLASGQHPSPSPSSEIGTQEPGTSSGSQRRRMVTRNAQGGISTIKISRKPLNREEGIEMSLASDIEEELEPEHMNYDYGRKHKRTYKVVSNKPRSKRKKNSSPAPRVKCFDPRCKKKNCTHSYANDPNAHRHARIAEQGKIYKCKHCSYTASQASHITEHIASVHDPTVQFPCRYCGKILKWNNVRTRHEEKFCPLRPKQSNNGNP